MAGVVLGRYFKLVLTPLLHAGSGCKALAARVEEIQDDAEIEWIEFADAIERAAATVSERELVEIGERIVRSQKQEFERWGFDSAEAMLTDLDAPFGSLIIDVPEHERLTTAKYDAGYAVFRIGMSHPGALLEGYLRGIVESHDGTVHELARHRVQMDGQPFHLIELRWWTPARLVARRRPASGPRLVA